MDYTTKTPGELAEVILQLTAEYETLADELAELLKLKDINWTLFRDTVTSDKQADRLWFKTEPGTREQSILLQMKKIQRTISSIKIYLKVKENEARNIY